MATSLHDHLWSLNADEQKAWLKQAGAWDKTLTKKADFIAAIKTQLGAGLEDFVAKLSEAERKWLGESAHQGRLIGVREYEAKFGGRCPMPKRYYSYNEERSLLVALIAFPRYHSEGEPELVAELRAPLRALLPRPAVAGPKTRPDLPKFWPSEQQGEGGEKIRAVHVHEGERIAPAELSRVLRLIQGGKVKITESSGRPTEATTRLLAETLVVPDFALEPPKSEVDRWTQEGGPVRAHAWGVLVQQCGWAKAQRGELKLTPEGQALLKGFSPEVFRAGVDRFLADDDFDELHRINHIRGQTGKAKRWISDPGLRKLGLETALSDLPVGEWLDYEEALRVAVASGEEWDVLTEDAGALYFAELRYGVIYDQGGINSQYLRALFLESFATLGLFDVGYVYPHWLWPDLSDSWGIDDLSYCGRYDGLLYVRLNPLGAYALGYTDRYEAAVTAGPKSLRILPALEIRAELEPLNAADRAMLELMALPQDERVWVLDQERILAHVEAGGSMAELRQFLEANAEGGLPEDMTAYLDAAEHRIGAFRRSREAVLLEWEDEQLARYLAGEATTAALCHHAGGNRLVVAKDQLSAFRRAVKKLGFVVRADK